MNSRYNLIPKFTTLLAVGACILTAHQATAAGVVAAGDQFGAAINENGVLRTFGLNDVGQLGLGNTTSPQPLPTEVTISTVPGETFAAVEAGKDFLFAISEDGNVYATGANGSGQLGIGNTNNTNAFKLLTFQGSPKIVDIGAGHNYAYGIADDGTLYAWGENGNYELGIGVYNDPNPESLNDSTVERPIKVNSGLWKDVDAAKSDTTAFTVGVKADGTLWVWGQAASLVGGPTGVLITTPIQLGTASDWESVEVGNLQVIARKTNGKVYTWGAGIALGQGSTKTTSATPLEIKISGVSGFSDIGVGYDTSFAITNDGRLFGWGNNNNLQLGPNIIPNTGNIQFFPVEISTGNTFSAAVGGYGSVDPDTRDGFTLSMGVVNGESGFYTFGANVNGQLGVGAISYGLNAYPVRSLADGLEFAVSAPTVNNVSTSVVIGLNTSKNIAFTVANSGEVPISGGYTVNLYLGPAGSELDVFNDELLATQTVNETLAVNGSKSFTFNNILFNEIEGGDYVIYAQVSLIGTALQVNVSGSVAETPVSIREPNILLKSVTIPNGDELDIPGFFENVTLTFDNPSAGIIPNGTPIPVNVYLSEDTTLDEGDLPLVVTPSLDYSGGLIANATGVRVPPLPSVGVSIAIPDVSSGQRYLIFVADENNELPDSNPNDNTLTKAVSLFKDSRIDLAIDYGYYVSSGSGNWTSIDDTLASGGLAYISPTIDQNQSATYTTMIQGPREITVPWRIEGSSSGNMIDNVTIDIVGGAFSFPTGSDMISGYVPTYQTNTIKLEDDALYTVNWIYNQETDFTQSFAILDIDIPVFRNTGDGEWLGIEPGPNQPQPKVGDRMVMSPDIAQGESASFEVDVIGPALVSFWVNTNSDPEDTLTFLVDGVVRNLPTSGFDEDPQAAVFSGVSGDWFQVAFLVEGGERNLRWLYTKGSEAADSVIYVDGLAVLNPIPEENASNVNTGPLPDYAFIPQYNVDLAVQDVVATPGNYILDDANGTGRLPISIVVGSVGSDFDVTAIAGGVNFASNIELRLSLDTTYGNSDDVILGNFAETQIVKQGNKIVMSADINLPFDTPAGNYNIFVRFLPPPVVKEFSYENNTVLLGPGFVIIRAPDLVATKIQIPSSSYPYHPEYTLSLGYTIFNRGLAPITLDDRFDVTVRLMAISRNGGLQADAIIIKVYDPYELSVFLPNVSATYPTGGSTDVNHFIDLPTLRDILVSLGAVPSGEPEDSANVYAAQQVVTEYVYYFDITLDSANDILESSETNLFTVTYYDEDIDAVRPQNFSIYPTPSVEDYGSFTGQFPFSDFLDANSALDLSQSDVDTDDDNIYNLMEYGLGTNPTVYTPIFTGGDNPQNVVGSYNVQSLIIPPSTTPQEYLTISFPFNVRANDITITLQASDDMAFDENLLTLTPPYTDDFGPQSLTGFNGLKDNPLVLAVEGNVTAVQQVYTARITIRDNQPLATVNDQVDYTSRMMRLVVTSNLAPPGLPTNLSGAYNGLTGNVNLSWIPDNQINPAQGGSFQIYRSLGALNDFEVIGSTTNTSFIDNDVSSLTGYTYRVRLVNASGISGYSNSVNVVVP